MLWCLNWAISELGNTIPCTVHQTKQPVPRGSKCNVDTIQRAALALASSQYRVAAGRCGAYTNRTACRDFVVTSHVLQQMAGQFVSTEKPENRVYSIIEGAPKGKQCLHTTYFPSSSEVRFPGLLELSSINFPPCVASSWTGSEFDYAF
jgi:hypothetical protein